MIVNKIFSLLVIALCTASHAQTKKVLFIGNSYTSYNNLPKMIADAAATTGDTLVYDSHTLGGYSLKVHSQNATVYAKMRSNSWDYVTIQAQSQEPSFPTSQVETETFPYAKILCDSVRQINDCSTPLFYMTWGRENGDSRNCQFASWLCTYEGMDDSLYSRYMYMANVNKALVSPVGRVWRYLRTNHPTIDLYTADESHPSAAGSYAAMCAFYATIFQKDPTAISYNFSLSASDALQIRQAAKQVVYDSLATWNHGRWPNQPSSNFTFATVKDSVQFYNNSQNASTYTWDFGDGTSSTVENPSHVYSAIGNFSVSLVTEGCKKIDSSRQTITISELSNPGDTTTQDSALSNYSFEQAAKLYAYPNPGSDHIWINGAFNLAQITFYDGTGALAFRKRINQHQAIDVSHLKRGLYFIEVESQQGQTSHLKWLKN